MTINALLGDKVLPSGRGHTTCCFVQVEKSENGKKELLTPEAPDIQDIKVRQAFLFVPFMSLFPQGILPCHVIFLHTIKLAAKYFNICYNP